MRRTILLIAAVGVALLVAGTLALVSGLGGTSAGAAQAQSNSERQEASGQQDQPRVESAAGRAQGRGVSIRPEENSRQVAPEAPREVNALPLGLTDEGKAALERARRGEGRPSGKEEVSPPADSVQPDAPALGTSFLGVADSGWFPPDTQIAAGPNNIVLATNGAVNIRNKNGTLRSSQTLVGFFSALGAEHNDVFDPWLVYDPYINRFWLLAESGRTAAHSDMVIGLSNTSDATLGWTLWELDATLNGNTDTSNWCDYPKLGFDAQAIYVTCNMFNDSDNFQYSKLRIMTKSQFVNNTAILWWDFWGMREGNVGTNRAVFTLQPAQMLDAFSSDGEFLVDAQGGGGNGSTLDVWRITNAAECCNGDGTGPTLSHNTHGVFSYSAAPGARQSGSTTRINTGDTRLLYAFWKGGRLSTGQDMACGSGGADACLGFTELNVSSFPTISTVNDWAYQTAGVDYYYPAVAVNSAGNKTMVFSRSSSSEFASARYIGIPSSSVCTLCVDGPETVLQNGGNSYVELDPSGRNRWGDYSGASPDPNGQGVWVAGEFATTTQNSWGVQVGLTYQTSPPPTNDNFVDAQFISGSNASVSGTTRFATREPPEPDHYVTNPPDSTLWVGDHSVWYSWTAPSSGPIVMDTCQANIDSILAIYTGFSLGGLSRVADNNNDNACASESDWGSKVTFNAVAGTTYRIAVGDAGGLRESTFTLRVIDQTPPKVTSTTPANNATRVAPGANVSATFSEPMQTSSVNTTTFKLKKAGTTTFLGATVTYDAATRTATLNPNNNLQSGRTYIAMVTTGTMDEAGNPFDQDSSTAGNQPKSWKFKVG